MRHRKNVPGANARRLTVGVAVALVTAMLALVPAGSGAPGACAIDVSVDAAHAPAGEWSSHAHPLFEWEPACEDAPALDSYVVYPSWGGAIRTTDTSLHADVPDGVHSVAVVAVWGSADGSPIDYSASRLAESPRVGVDTVPPRLDGVDVTGPHDARDGTLHVGPDARVQPAFHEDGSGLADVAYRVGWGPWAPVPEDGLALPGAHADVLQLRAVDRAGNVGAATLPVVVDDEPPTATIVEPGWHAAVPTDGELRIRVNAADAGSGVDQVRVSVRDTVVGVLRVDEPRAHWNGTLDWSPHPIVPDGAHDVTVTVVDATGNAADAGTIRVYVGEEESAAVRILGAADGPWQDRVRANERLR